MLNLRRGIGTHEPSVISLGQVWVDIMLNVDEVPAQGGFAVADHPKPSIGGSYRVLQAASRMGERLLQDEERPSTPAFWATACGRISSASHSKTTALRISARIVLMRIPASAWC